MKIQFSIVTKDGNTNTILIIIFLKVRESKPSMSRKGNSPDNGMMESFFGILKSEMFYGYENRFSHFTIWNKLLDYIDYYNNKRIR